MYAHACVVYVCILQKQTLFYDNFMLYFFFSGDSLCNEGVQPHTSGSHKTRQELS